MLELLPLVGIVLLFWLLIIRPASRRQRELKTMQSSLSEGAEVVLTSGVYGAVRGLEDDVVLVEVADGVVLKVARGAIGRIVPPEDPADELGDVPPTDHDPTNDEPSADQRRSEEN